MTTVKAHSAPSLALFSVERFVFVLKRSVIFLSRTAVFADELLSGPASCVVGVAAHGVGSTVYELFERGRCCVFKLKPFDI